MPTIQTHGCPVSDHSLDVEGDTVVSRSYIQAKLVRNNSPGGDSCVGDAYYLACPAGRSRDLVENRIPRTQL